MFRKRVLTSDEIRAMWESLETIAPTMPRGRWRTAYARKRPRTSDAISLAVILSAVATPMIRSLRP
jgi:hypothetical protein